MSQASETTTEHPWRDKETLQRLHHEEGLNYEGMAERLGCTRRTIAEWFSRHDLDARMGRPRKTRVLFYTSPLGYERWHDKRPPSQDKTVRLNRLLAVAEWGFDAVADNHVHHKNGIKWDNRIENLEVLSPSEHQKLHNRQDPPTGENNPNAKLTWDDVERIRRCRGLVSAGELADEFDVSVGQIRSIWRFEAWQPDDRDS